MRSRHHPDAISSWGEQTKGKGSEMVLKIGGWFELESCKSYVYARIGRREVIVKQNTGRCVWHAGTYSGAAPHSTFRVVI